MDGIIMCVCGADALSGLRIVYQPVRVVRPHILPHLTCVCMCVCMTMLKQHPIRMQNKCIWHTKCVRVFLFVKMKTNVVGHFGTHMNIGSACGVHSLAHRTTQQHNAQKCFLPRCVARVRADCSQCTEYNGLYGLFTICRYKCNPYILFIMANDDKLWRGLVSQASNCHNEPTLKLRFELSFQHHAIQTCVFSYYHWVHRWQ